MAPTKTTLSTIESKEFSIVYDYAPNIAYVNMLVHKYNRIENIMVDLDRLELPLVFYRSTKRCMEGKHNLYSVKRQILYYSGCSIEAELTHTPGRPSRMSYGYMFSMHDVSEERLARSEGYEEDLGLLV